MQTKKIALSLLLDNIQAKISNEHHPFKLVNSLPIVLFPPQAWAGLPKKGWSPPTEGSDRL